MDLAWVVFAEVVSPILGGVLVIALSPRWPSVGSHPFPTAFVLYLLLLVLTALAAPGYDLWVRFVGGLVSNPLASGCRIAPRAVVHTLA
jgi:hypothetical protein